jgi:hypothetical protein
LDSAPCSTTSRRAAGGGAILGLDSTITAEGCTFDGNHLNYDGSGGAIRVIDGDLTLDTCTLAGNRAPAAHGGAVAAESSSVHVVASAFSDNEAGLRGGAMHLDGTGASFAIEDTTFAQNTSSEAAGALWTARPGSLVRCSCC